tara:strand:+ start:387 stop:911 length:525 start_codon:yes stop_codon:yes gene_type:complete
MKYLKMYLLSFFLLLNYSKANSSDNINDIKILFEGRYELVYWKQDNLKFNYPQIAGTLVVKDNKISFTLDSNMKENETLKIIGWGNYNLSVNEYNYGYFDFKKMTDNGADMKVNKTLPWQGMRKYSVLLKNDKLLFTSSTGKQTWELDKKSLIYTDKEWGTDKKEVIRYWKRIQ